MRKSGILMPISSLPSKYGIGAFSQSAYEFVDQLVKAGQSYWQILPLVPTGYGDSPYQSFSTFSGNPYFIDLDELVNEGYLSEDECLQYDFGTDNRYIDYEKIYKSRFKILKTAYINSDIRNNKAFQSFIHNNAIWLDDYALFMAIKDKNDGKSWSEWDYDIRMRDASVLAQYKADLSADIEFYQFQQYEFNRQWLKLKKYANDKGIQIIGDVPIYVAYDSSDVWANPELFELDDNKKSINVAGCPPDSFSATGQLWGNPLYDWEYHKKTNYTWWIKRLQQCFVLYDVVRIDHFRGFDEYFSIPADENTAENGKWKKGPGYDIFIKINEFLEGKEIVAEDLGFLTDSVIKLREKTGYPGMKILQFAFDSREESDYFPHNYSFNSVVYTGTHDNYTLIGWFDSLDEESKNLCRDYLNVSPDDDKNIHWSMIRLGFASVSKLVVIPIYDYLGLDESARINIPAKTGGNNWKFRMLEGEFTDALASKIKHLVELYDRL